MLNHVATHVQIRSTEHDAKVSPQVQARRRNQSPLISSIRKAKLRNLHDQSLLFVPLNAKQSNSGRVSLVRLPSQRQKYTSKSTSWSRSSSQSETPDTSNLPKTRRIILSRSQNQSGQYKFILGTRSGETILPDENEVLLHEILDFVSPDELQKFENAEFLQEDKEEAEQDRLAALKKPRGRPQKQQFPQGTREQYDSNTFVRRHKKRGRPRKYPVPSFDGPKPLGDDTDEDQSRREQSSPSPSPTSTIRKPRVYPLVAAAGLGLESSDEESLSDDGSTRHVSSIDKRAQTPSYHRVMSSRTPSSRPSRASSSGLANKGFKIAPSPSAQNSNFSPARVVIPNRLASYQAMGAER